jgi:tRNA(His) guanylyltransferase
MELQPSVEDRMKVYEKKSKTYINPEGLIVMRLDGKGFSKYTSKLKRPFDEGLIEDMNEMACFLCSEIQGAILAYVQSDEISIFIWNKGKSESQIWFKGAVQKMTSISASWASAKFNQLRMLRACSDDSLSAEKIKSFRLAAFDSRVFEVPDEKELLNCFIWRQKDFKRNSISAVAREYLSKSLEFVDTRQMVSMLEEKGISWENDYPQDQKYGRMIVKEQYEKDGAIRNRWIAKSAVIFWESKELFREMLGLTVKETFL